MKIKKSNIDKINLQLFAEEGEGTPETEPTTEKQEQADEKTFKQDELNEIVSKRLAKEQAKWEKEYSEKLEKEKAEAEKLAKMSAEQRAKAEFEKEQQKFLKERETFEREKLSLEVKKQLSEEGLSQDFASFLIGADAEESMNNINTFKEAYRREVEAEVLKKLSGNTPKAGEQSNTSKKFSEMTYEEMVALKKSNPSEYERILNGK